jgi:hypothetical protein
MAEVERIRISAVAAACIGPQAQRAQKLAAARGEEELAPRELGIVLLYLCNDPDAEIKLAARQRMLGLPADLLLAMIEAADTHPRILDLVARCHYQKQLVVDRLLNHPALATATAAYLTEKTAVAVVAPVAPAPQVTPSAETAPDEDEEYVEESEEHHNKYQLAQIMGVGDKIKMAMTGDKEWRSILIKDSNKQVSGAVIKNPRISENEVLNIAKSAIQNDEILRVICNNKEWVKNSQIRKALVENHRTPLHTALRFMATLSDKDLAMLAKSKNVSTVISTQARRLLMQKKKE